MVDPPDKLAIPMKTTAMTPANVKPASMIELASIIVFTPFLGMTETFRRTGCRYSTSYVLRPKQGETALMTSWSNVRFS